MGENRPTQPARIGLWRARSVAGPFHRRHDGIGSRDALYEQLFMTVALRPGEELRSSWVVKDPPPEKLLSFANEGMGNLILTSARLLYEPFVPPKFKGGPATTTALANVMQNKWRDSQRNVAEAFDLSDVLEIEVPEVEWPRRAGAPLRIVTPSGDRLYQVWHRGLISRAARNRAARDAAAREIRAAVLRG